MIKKVALVAVLIMLAGFLWPSTQAHSSDAPNSNITVVHFFANW